MPFGQSVLDRQTSVVHLRKREGESKLVGDLRTANRYGYIRAIGRERVKKKKKREREKRGRDRDKKNINNKTIFRKVSPHRFSAYSVSYSPVLGCHLPHPPANLFLESQPPPQLRGCVQRFHTFSCQDCFLWQREKKSIKRARF